MSYDRAAAMASVETAIQNITAEMATISAHPKPFYTITQGNGIGQVMSAVEYRRFLSDEVSRLIDLRRRLGEPWLGLSRWPGHGNWGAW